MLDVAAIREELTSKIDGLEREATLVYTEVMRPRWGGELHGLPQTLYGYMMMCFAWIDLLSAYWQGDLPSRGSSQQTRRMLDFMDRYISRDREANNVAIKCWRHQLMHTAEPRRLHDAGTGITYNWLLHWWVELPAEQHYSLNRINPGHTILSLGLIYLVADIRRGLKAYLSDLELDVTLQNRFEHVQGDLGLQPFRPV